MAVWIKACIFGVLSVILLASCTSVHQLESDAVEMDESTYRATLYRTEGGIPHVIASGWRGLGYGQGYASAQDHFCELARNILKFRARLSATFGAKPANLRSDLFYQLQIDQGLYDVAIDSEFEALFDGYAAGFNRYLREHEINKVNDPQCTGADWIVEMTPDDVRRFNLTPAFLQGFAPLMVAATPSAAPLAG